MTVVASPLYCCAFCSDEWFFKLNNLNALAFEPFSRKAVCLVLVCIFGKTLLLLSFVTSWDLGHNTCLHYVFLIVFQCFPSVVLVNLLHGSSVQNYTIFPELELTQTSKSSSPLFSPKYFLCPPGTSSLIFLRLKNIVAMVWICALLAWLHLLKRELLKVHLPTPCTLCVCLLQSVQQL